MLAIDLIDFTSQARRTGELSLRATRARKMFYHTFVYLAATICTLPILIFAVAPQLPTIVKLSSIGGCFISDDQDGKIVGFILVTIPKAIGLFFNCGACVRRSFGALARVQLRFPSSPRSPPQRRGATECVARHQCARAHRCTPLALPPPSSALRSYLVAVARVCSRRFPTVVGRRHAAQTSRFLLVYLLCYTPPAVRHAWILREDFTGSDAYSVLQFIEAILLPLAGFFNAIVYGLNRHFTPQSGLRALLRGESGVMVGESKVVSFKDHRYLNADECQGKEWRDSQYVVRSLPLSISISPPQTLHFLSPLHVSTTTVTRCVYPLTLSRSPAHTSLTRTGTTASKWRVRSGRACVTI